MVSGLFDLIHWLSIPYASNVPESIFQRLK